MRMLAAAVFAIAALAFAAEPAEAAKKRRTAFVPGYGAYSTGQAGVVVNRARTRVRVTKRSYLDAGTEVYEGSMHYTDYAFPPAARGPMDLYAPELSRQSPLPHPWDLRSYHAPSWGY